ncbi:isocitrate lyase/phosphoenolpyruvate mutase family protein [Rhizobium sp. SG570]|uniref:isocitrate lyase/PEP mutase family protein n=1 Tax=Rhizobium sp. SG570 TaxID=2587113 RepID=UPI001444EC0D|nr:isocitrate lyase/phosphoenolpyruvate mutase family protein [Rhizobium sp. SG570]NKJ39571.1 2-methylisocitrate lyase-like PEP mutase family enzyme [Rhizobium sp. SG570]NRP90636.1 Carboxyvinyl-carboxyphosphonate phosphorylmutase [Ensifer adhaerens]
MSQAEKAKEFAALHVKGNPVILYNAWDAGSAKAIAEAGAKAIATSSWSVAAAQGYSDGEDLPIAIAEQIVARIASSVELPVSVDFEGGYSDDDHQLAANISKLLDLGVIGINFEDRIVKGKGLYDIDRQANRIAEIRRAAEHKGIPLFINARTDVFFRNSGDVEEALQREKAYAAAGASGFFIPGVTDADQIKRIASEATLPVNVMVMEGLPSNEKLATLGVARVSYGPIPYIEAMDELQKKVWALPFDPKRADK